MYMDDISRSRASTIVHGAAVGSLLVSFLLLWRVDLYSAIDYHVSRRGPRSDNASKRRVCSAVVSEPWHVLGQVG